MSYLKYIFIILISVLFSNKTHYNHMLHIDTLSKKPERIYNVILDPYNNILGDIVVPEGKAWKIFCNDYPSSSGQIKERWAFQNESPSWPCGDWYAVFTIFEYSISGSGTDQGMDYVEP